MDILIFTLQDNEIIENMFAFLLNKKLPIYFILFIRYIARDYNNNNWLNKIKIRKFI